MSIESIEEEIIEEFELFGDDWESKYEHLIDLGRSLPLIDSKFKTDQHLINGCQSKVWLHSEFLEGKIVYTADCDAIITKGIVALMIRVLSYHAPKEITEARLSFIDKIGLKEHLSATRANGLVSMVQQMKKDAQALTPN
jgi:cysteine desulfuration protein SufE